MKTVHERSGVSSTVFGAVTLVLLIVAASGFYLYSTASAKTTTTTLTSVSTSVSTQVSTSVSTSLEQLVKSGGYIEGKVSSFNYNQNFVCAPSLTALINNAESQNASKVTPCVVGAGNRSAVSGAFPVFVLVPAFAGLSNFGVTQLGASAQGYPVFNGQTIVTQCGAGGSQSACPFHPTYLYSPVFTLVEQHLGIKQGIFGLPEGVLPTPAHDHVVGFLTNNSIPWYTVAVLVFDPNIFPDPITGQCHQWVNSNLSSSTGNCLNSFSALTAAMDTKTTATANANATQNNPIYDTLGGVSTQVLIPGVTIISETSGANINLFLYFSVTPQNPLSSPDTTMPGM